MPVAFEELEGSPTMRHTFDGFIAQRVLRIAWNDWPELIRELWGSYRMVGDELVFTPPAHFPGVPQAIVTDVEIEPFDGGNPTGPAVLGVSTGTNSYAGGARATVKYETLFDLGRSRPDLPEVPPGTALLFQADLAGEMASTPGRNWRFSMTGNPPADEHARIEMFLPSDELRLTWLRVPRPPWGAMIELRGQVNDATFLGFPPETVMFLGARTRRDFQLLDTGLWRLDYLFKARAVTSTVNPTIKHGWNHQWRGEPSGGEHWLKLVDSGGSVTPYANTSFDALFAFG